MADLVVAVGVGGGRTTPTPPPPPLSLSFVAASFVVFVLLFPLGTAMIFRNFFLLRMRAESSTKVGGIKYI